MVKIAADTPKELIDILNRIDYSLIASDKQQSIVSELYTLAVKYVMPRKGKIAPANVKKLDITGCPQILATMISSLDFNSLDSIKKNIGKQLIIQKLQSMGLYK